eukprot:ctg_468.g242
MGAALNETGERGMSTPAAAVLLKDASTDECRFVGGEDGCRKRPKAVESSWERESTVEIDMSVESECWASPVVRPTLDELQRFPEYVQEHLAEWEPYGLVVVQLPDQLDMNALLELPEVAERVMQQTRARPRVQRFPQFRSRRDDRGGSWSSKRSRLFDAPAFAESGHDCTLAQHREHAQTEAARITTRLLGDGDAPVPHALVHLPGAVCYRCAALERLSSTPGSGAVGAAARQPQRRHRRRSAAALVAVAFRARLVRYQQSDGLFRECVFPLRDARRGRLPLLPLVSSRRRRQSVVQRAARLCGNAGGGCGRVALRPSRRRDAQR